MRVLRAKTKRYVITYVALLGHPNALIQPDDIMPLQEVLKGIPAREPVELLISSPGGLPDTVEKIRTLCRDGRVGFTTVVPNYAKSAATLLCLGSDEIMMGPTSELGPIDPQMFRNGVFLPAHAHINSYKKTVDEINNRGKLLPADFPVLSNVDIAFIEFCDQRYLRRTKCGARTGNCTCGQRFIFARARTTRSLRASLRVLASASRVLRHRKFACV